MNKRYAVFALIALALVAAGAARAQTLLISPNPISLYAQLGTTSSAPQIVTFTSSDNTTAIPFNVSPGNAWITVVSAAPAGGWTTPATVTITVNPSQLPLGQNVGSLIVSGPGLFKSVPVNVTVSTIGVILPSGQTGSLALGTYAAGSTVYPPSIPALTVTGDTTNLKVTKGANDTWYTFQVFGTPPSAVEVTFNSAVAASLSPGSLAGTLTLTPEGANPVPVAIPVTMTVTKLPQVTVSPGALVYNWQSGGTANEALQYITLTSNAPQAINFSVSVPGFSWITLPSSNATSIPANGSVQVGVQVAGDAQGLGTDNGSIQISIPGGGALFSNGSTILTVPVTLNVSLYTVLYLPPTLTSLNFNYQFGSSTTPTPQALTPTSSGTPMSYTVSQPACSWVTIAPQPGQTLTTNGGSFTVGVNVSQLTPGSYGPCNVVINPVANGSGQASITIPVSLNVTFQNLLRTNQPSNTMVFAYQVGQATPPPQIVKLTSVTGAPLNYTVSPPSSTAGWVQVSGALTGSTDQTQFSVAIVPAGIPSPPPSSYLDATINITATDPSTGAAVPSISIDVRLYASTTPQLVLSATTPAISAVSPLLLSTWINSTRYPSDDQGPVTIYLTSTQPVTEELSVTSVQRTVSNQSTTGDWLSLTNPLSQTPTSFSLQAVVNPSTMPVGTYNGSVSVSATAPPNGATVADNGISIPVQLIVNSAKGSVSYAQSSSGALTFTHTKGAAPLAAQVVSVNTDSATSYPFFAVVNTGSLNWITLSGISGPTPGSFNVSVDDTNLPIGVYQGAIYVNIPSASPNPDGSPMRIPVTFNVNGGTICAGSCSSPTQSLTFTQVVGGATPAPQSVSITSTPSSVNYTVNATVTSPANGTWLSAAISTGGGATPGSVTVSVTPGNLTAGNYQGTVTITSAGATGSPINIPVTLTLQQATITAPTTPLIFNQLAGGPPPAAQMVTVASVPSGVNFTVTATPGTGAGWLTATAGPSGTSGTTGTPSGTIQVSVNGASLSPNPYTGLVTITSPGATGSPISIPILLTVGPAVQLSVSQSSLSFGASVGQATTPQTVQLTSSASTTFTVSTSTKDNGAWLSVNPASGVASASPVTLTVSANTQSLVAGTYTGTVTISSTSSLTPATISVSLVVAAIPTPVVTAVVNAASWVAGAVSPGENIVIGGAGIGPAQLVQVQQLTSAGTFPTTLGNTQVLFDGIAAPIIYASATQTSVMVPYEIGGRSVTNLQVVYSGVPSTGVPYNVVQAAPGIYAQNSRGFGPGSVVNADGTINGPNNPAAKGAEVYLYMTGEGATSPASTDGAIANTPGNTLNKPLLPVSVTVNGVPAPTIQYWGSAPGIIYGVMQVNFTIPPSTPTGAQALLVTVGNYTTAAGVTVAVQ